MSTAVQFCPPMPAHTMLEAEPQFHHIAQPISATFGAHGEAHSTGISFGDYQRMTCFSKKSVTFWRTGVPAWIFDPNKFREVVVSAVEIRAGFREPQAGTQNERLARAETKIKAVREKHIAEVDSLCARYVASVNDERRELEAQIENLDTRLRTDEHPAAVVAAILYLSYNARMKSPQVGEILGLKSCHVRQILHRCKIIAERVENGWPNPHKCGKNPPVVEQKARC